MASIEELRAELETLRLQNEIDQLKDGAPVPDDLENLRRDVNATAERIAVLAGDAIARATGRLEAVEQEQAARTEQVTALADLVGRFQGLHDVLEKRVAALEARDVKPDVEPGRVRP